jgi:hypothetical protein
LGNASVWQWLTLLLICGGIGFVARKATLASRAKAEAGVPLEGFGGWLLLLALGQVIGAIASVTALNELFREWPEIVKLPQGQLFVIGEIVLCSVVCVTFIYTTIVMLRKQRTFRRWFTFQVVLAIAVSIIRWTWISGTLGIEYTEGYSVTRIVAVSIVYGVWVWYLNISRRAANTFIR